MLPARAPKPGAYDFFKNSHLDFFHRDDFMGRERLLKKKYGLSQRASGLRNPSLRASFGTDFCGVYL